MADMLRRAMSACNTSHGVANDEFPELPADPPLREGVAAKAEQRTNLLSVRPPSSDRKTTKVGDVASSPAGREAT
jgi:hypothetical protein